MANKDKPDEYWIEKAKKLKGIRTRLMVEDAMNALGYSSKAAAVYALRNMERIGLVEHKEHGDSGAWFLVESHE
jgi:hypothetical protein